MERQGETPPNIWCHTPSSWISEDFINTDWEWPLLLHGIHHIYCLPLCLSLSLSLSLSVYISISLSLIASTFLLFSFLKKFLWKRVRAIYCEFEHYMWNDEVVGYSIVKPLFQMPHFRSFLSLSLSLSFCFVYNLYIHVS